MTNLSDAAEILKQARALQTPEKKPKSQKATQTVVVKGEVVPPVYNLKSSDGEVIVKMMGEEPLKKDEKIIAE